MKFFIDHNFPPVLATVLDELSQQYLMDTRVVHLRSKFEVTVSDFEWIQTLSTEGDWVIISRDKLNKKGTKGHPERKILQESGLTSFLFVKKWAHRRSWDLIWNFIRWWPAIVEHSERITPGIGFLVPDASPDTKSGRLVPLW